MVFSEGAKVFGRLQLLRKLGEGRCSVVWLTDDPRFRRQIALKVFRTEAHEATEEERRLWRELLRRQRIVNHPSMVMPLEFFSEMGFIAIAGTFVEGLTLAQLLKRHPDGRFAFEEARKWLVQVGLAMVSAHGSAKIIHGNLNAFNVLINSAGDAKINDFGFHPPISARSPDADGASIRLKLACLSPERCEGRTPSFADDVYAFGALALQLLTGRNPAGGGPEAARDNMETLNSVGGLPDAWRKHIVAALSLEPVDRPVSFTAMMLDLAPEEFQEQKDPQEAIREQLRTARRQRMIMSRGSRRRKRRNALILRALLILCAIALPLIVYRTITLQREADQQLTAKRVLAEQVERARLDTENARKRELAARLTLEEATQINGGDNLPEPKAPPQPPQAPVISTSARKFLERGQGAAARGDFESAITNYNLAVVLQPDWPELLETRGFALLKDKHAEAAIADFNKALALDSTRVNARLGRGLASQALGDVNGARQDLEAVVKTKPDSGEAREALEALKK